MNKECKIGPEIMDATLRILEAAGAQLKIDTIEVGENVYLSGNTTGIADSTTINTGTVQLKTQSGSVVPVTVTYDANNQRATLTPSAALTLNTTYTVLVEGGSGTVVKDSSGMAMAAASTTTGRCLTTCPRAA